MLEQCLYGEHTGEIVATIERLVERASERERTRKRESMQLSKKQTHMHVSKRHLKAGEKENELSRSPNESVKFSNFIFTVVCSKKRDFGL